ncbi:MAG: agmatinase family protein [Prevotellaceae bacterium]|jgi:agmatinase|nr:agmatinase family protein [Prevotellaceae bacterium]
MNFNPNSIGIPNGSYFALPQASNAALTLIPVPWDVTTSYRAGTAGGPQAILDASAQVDLFDLENGEAWKNGIGTLPESDKIRKLGQSARKDAEAVIALLEEGEEEDSAKLKPYLLRVNNASRELNDWVYKQAKNQLHDAKLVGLVGGDHSVPLGLVKALSEVHSDFGLLHIDAHADLRQAYEGFEFSHASIMYNTLQHVPQVSALVQVGIRDLCTDEAELAAANERVHQFNDYALNAALLNGKTWAQLCGEILAKLPQKVYISFDIDGLSPDLCPNTGTPVPGGLSFHQACFLINELVKLGKTIIGFDLCEVSPAADGSEWDATVGARVLYKLCGYCIRSQKS